MKTIIQYAFKITLVAFLLISCDDTNDSGKIDTDSGNDWDIVIPSSAQKPGMGNTDGEPEGVAWQLPEGIELVARPSNPFNSDLSLLYGSINTFYADVNFINHKTDSVWVQIPKGLVFRYKWESRMQDGLHISDVKIKIPPTFGGGVNDTTTVYVGLGCLNASKALPWEENQEPDTRDYPIGKDMYKAGVITSDKNLQQLLDILKDYPKLALTQHYNPRDLFDDNTVLPEWMEIYGHIQEALWQITDGPGINRKEYRKLLEALQPYK